MKILAVNPGSTSTKIAVYENDRQELATEITFARDQFAGHTHIMDQMPRREADIHTALGGMHTGFDAVAGRGGLVGPVGPGGYRVDDYFCDVIAHRPVLEHASNLGGPLAARLARTLGKPGCLALTYDPVTVDEMDAVCRVTGVAGLERKSIGHHLNMRAVARRAAARLEREYGAARLIVAHLGGGATACAIAAGVMVDFVSDDELHFSAERCGGVPVKELLALARSTPLGELSAQLRTRAGLAGLLGTTDLRVVEERISAGDQRAALVFAALALQVSKTIATLAVSLHGAVDAIALTGGMARSTQLVAAVRERTAWIAQVLEFGGEFEMEALALGALRILQGRETLHSLAEFVPAAK